MKQTVPWLYYESQGKAVSESTKLTMRLALDSSDVPSTVILWLARYTMNGTFLGYSELTSQLSLCDIQSVDDITAFKSVGHNYLKECDYDLTQIINATETTFYELFIQDTGTSAGKLVDVPVRILNYDSSTDKTTYKYVHRFFLYDNICMNKASDPSLRYIRWAYSMSLRIQLRTDANEQIYVPILTIEYHERSVDYIKGTNSNGRSSFTVTYFMSPSYFLYVALIFLIILTIIALAIAAYRIYVWWQSNPSNPRELYAGSYKFYAAWSGIYLACHTWSLTFFWYLFSISAYWYALYKIATRSYLFLPDSTDYGSAYIYFDAVFGALLATQLITVILKIASQVTCDFFFIDWETPKVEERQGKIVSKVNVWRSIIVANEFGELMCEGLLSVTLNYIIFIFFF